MKSDVIHVTAAGDGTAQALAQAEAVARYKSLPDKAALHLRLLTEEMMGLLRAITGEVAADFWIEDDGAGEFRLHLVTSADMNLEMRRELLSASTSGVNAAAKGFMGKIRDLFQRSFEPVDSTMPDYCSMGWMYTGVESADVAMATAIGMWSLNRYKESLEKSSAKAEQWDELEKSVVAKLADEVQVSIGGSRVEMVIFKKF